MSGTVSQNLTKTEKNTQGKKGPYRDRCRRRLSLLEISVLSKFQISERFLFLSILLSPFSIPPHHTCFSLLSLASQCVGCGCATRGDTAFVILIHTFISPELVSNIFIYQYAFLFAFIIVGC